MSAAVAVPILAFLTVVFCVPPFVWHVKNRNLAASSLVFWVVLSNLFNFINSLIWTNGNLDGWWRGYVLCDIEVKLMNAANVGIPASLVAVMRSLALVLGTNNTILRPTTAQRRRKLAIDALLCFGAPIYMIIIHYFVQSIRYYIFAVSGCVPGFDSSWPSIVLVHIWSPFFSLVDVYYSILVVHRVRKYRKEFRAILHASNSGLTKSRFQRLFFMCLVLTTLGVPVQFYILYKNCIYPLVPYSWSRIHSSGWRDIILIPTDGSVTYDRWVQLAVGLTIFIFFGLGRDAINMYRRSMVKMGFGRVFPSLLVPKQQSDRQPSILSETGSFSSRVYGFVKRKLSRNSFASSGHTRNESTSTCTITSSPKPQQRPFSPLPMIETAIDTTMNESTVSTLAEKPTADSSTAATRPNTIPNIPESAHTTAPSRLARFLQHMQLSNPYNGIHAISPFTQPRTARTYHVSAQRPSTDAEMQGAARRREGAGMVHTRDYAAGV